MTLQTLINRDRVKITSELTDHNPQMPETDWSRTASHYRVTLRRKGRRLTIVFSQGPAICHDPTAVDVLDCLLSDYWTAENAGGFEYWCRELGYDEDSRAAERTYHAVVAQSAKLERFLGDDLHTYATAER